MRMHEVGPLQVGDQVYVFASPRFVPLLDRLFASPAALTERDLDYFGEFTVDPARPIGDIARSYGVAIAADEEMVSIGDYIARRLGYALGRGDRLLVAPVELIVREVDEKGAPISVGLALEPSPASAPKLPIFQNFRQIAAALRARLERRKEERKVPTRVEPAGEAESGAPLAASPEAEPFRPVRNEAVADRPREGGDAVTVSAGYPPARESSEI
jgi:cell volume regulation protein A